MVSVLAVIGAVMGWLLGLAMAVHWGIADAPEVPGISPLARWMQAAVPVEEAGRLYFASMLLILPVVWQVTGAVSTRARRVVVGAVSVAAVAFALEYNGAEGYGWLFDLLALFIALAGTLVTGVLGLRRHAIPASVAWALIAAVPMTPLAALLVLGYMAPAAAMGLLIAWAVASVAWVRSSRVFAMDHESVRAGDEAISGVG